MSDAVLPPFPADDPDRYALRGRRQIRQLLQQLIDARALVTVYPNAGPGFASRVLELVDDGDALLLDGGPDAEINRRTLQSTLLRCVSQLDGIRIQFDLDGVDAEQADGHPAFNAWLPSVILRLQRREFFRLETPLQQRPQCTLQLHAAAGEARTLQVPVIDIGAGGLAVLVSEDAASLSVGDQLAGCGLQLPGAAALTLDLQVRNIGVQRFPGGIVRQRIGFSFRQLPADIATVLERYILNAQRARGAHQRPA